MTRDQSLIKLGTRKKLPAHVGMMSIIGTSDERPVSWGNYFWLSNPDINVRDDQPRVANFWAENLETLVEDGTLSDGLVEVIQYDEGNRSWCLIDDPRIPDDWYYNKLCFTGCYPPPRPILEEMYAYLGDPTNEIERYISPETYWPKHNAEYRDGVIIRRFPDSDQSSDIKYKGKTTVDAAVYYTPYKVEELEPVTLVGEGVEEALMSALTEAIKTSRND